MVSSCGNRYHDCCMTVKLNGLCVYVWGCNGLKEKRMLGKGGGGGGGGKAAE